MTRTIYHNNDVEITLNIIDKFESKVDVNGQNLIWISNLQADEFKRKLSTLLDEFRI